MYDHYSNNEPASGAPLFAEGAFDRSPAKPTAEELVVGNMIWKHKGSSNPLPIGKISEVTGYNARQVKSIVEQLVVKHRLKIGGSRIDPWGYFIAETAEDLQRACEPFESQVLAMWKRLQVLKNRHELRELLGQLTIEEAADAQG